MIEGNEPNINNGRKWQFWFLVATTLLLFVTFVLYLPTRFERNFLQDEGHMTEEMPHMDEEMTDMMHGEGHGGAILHEEGEVAEGLAVYFKAIPTPAIVSISTALGFSVNMKPGNIPVRVSDLEFNHEKLMHVIGVRSDLNDFFHIHPESFGEGIFAIPHVFSAPGTYKLWSEVMKDGVTHSFGHPTLEVQGAGTKERKNVSFTRNVVTGDYQAVLQMKEPVVKGREHDLSFDIHTKGGSEVVLENYLGVQMHLAVIKDDLSQFIHTHPEEAGAHSHSFLPLVQEAQANGGPPAGGHGHDVPADVPAGEDGTVNFHVVFPEAGLYKVFAQFRPLGIGLPQDEALTASFWIEVKEKATISQAASWWILLIVSVFATVLLSIAVHKFITVRK